MKATGIVRKVDCLGRVVIPKEFREKRGWDMSTPLEIFKGDDAIILREYQPACIFCDRAEGVTKYKGKKVCSNCRKELEQK